MATGIITEKSLRVFLMDKPELNPLLGGLRWSPEDIEEACINVIAYFNESTPATGRAYTVENFPFRYCLTVGVAGYLLKSASINEAVNELEYSAAGVSVQDKNKAPIFNQLGSAFWDEYKEIARGIKTNQYTSLLFGVGASEYDRTPTNFW